MIVLELILFYILENLDMIWEGELSFEGWVEFVLFLEILFLLFITATSFCVRYYRDLKRFFRTRFMASAHRKVERVLLAEGAPLAPPLKFFERKVENLVPILERLDLYHKSARWELLKKNIIKNYLDKKALKYSAKWGWKKRNLALRIFLLDLKSFPEEVVLGCLEDPLPLNQMHAALCAGQLGTKASVNALIDQMVYSGRFGRFAYEDALLQGTTQSLYWVKERYEREVNPMVRRVCLEILAQRVGLGIMREMLKDLNSQELELKLAAIRAMGNQPSEQAVTSLLLVLEDELWVVRATAAKSLGRIGDVKAAPHLIKGLRDREWWVRMNSAVALGQLGEKGRQMLRLQDPDVDPYAFDMAQYVLALVES